MCVCVCVCVCLSTSHSSSSLCDVPEFRAAAALDDSDIKEELLQKDSIAVSHILCNRM